MIREKKLKTLYRSRIQNRLEAIKELPLFMLIAPMGYGKTQAVKNFLHTKISRGGGKTVWLTFSSISDDDWVWQQFLSLLRTYSEEHYREAKGTELFILEKRLSLCIRQFVPFLEEELYLVLDDFQEYHGELLKTVLVEVAKLQTPFLHIIIMSRVMPKLPVEELELKGLCDTMLQYEIALNQEEIKEFFHINDVELPDAEVGEVLKYSDGWIAAVYFIILDYIRYGCMKSYGSITHMLKTSFYDKLYPEEQQVLMQMSLFDAFTVEQANAVTQRTDCESLLTRILQNSFGIDYDPLKKLYRAHEMLRIVLRSELEKTPHEVRLLYLRCAKWYRAEKNYMSMLQMLVHAEEYTAVDEFLRRSNCFYYFEIAPTFFTELFMHLQWEEKQQLLYTYLMYLCFYISYVNRKEGLLLYSESLTYIEENKARIKQSGCQAACVFLQNIVLFNDLHAIGEGARKGVAAASVEVSESFVKTVALNYTAPNMLSLYHSRVGGLSAVIEDGRIYDEAFVQRICRCDVGWHTLMRAEYAYLTGDFLLAGQLGKEAYQKIRSNQRYDLIASCSYVLVRCALYFGNEAQLQELLAQLDQDIAAVQRPAVSTAYRIVQNYAYACLGRFSDVSEWMHNMDFSGCNYLMRFARSACIAYGQLLCGQGRYDALEALAVTLETKLDLPLNQMALLYAKVFRAIAAWKQKKKAKAERYLEEGLLIAKPDGIVNVFIEYARELLPLYLLREKQDAYIRQLIPDCSVYLASMEQLWSGARRPVHESLTERERLVLELVADGKKNKEIGEALHLAQITVEKILTSCYQKLGVRNRAGAIARLNEMDAGK